MPVKYKALYVFVITILLETVLIATMTYSRVYTYGLGEEDNFYIGKSSMCYEKKGVGKVCLIEQKVYWYERVDIEGVKK